MRDNLSNEKVVHMKIDEQERYRFMLNLANAEKNEGYFSQVHLTNYVEKKPFVKQKKFKFIVRALLLNTIVFSTIAGINASINHTSVLNAVLEMTGMCVLLVVAGILVLPIFSDKSGSDDEKIKQSNAEIGKTISTALASNNLLQLICNLDNRLYQDLSFMAIMQYDEEIQDLFKNCDKLRDTADLFHKIGQFSQAKIAPENQAKLEKIQQDTFSSLVEIQKQVEKQYINPVLDHAAEHIVTATDKRGLVLLPDSLREKYVNKLVKNM